MGQGASGQWPRAILALALALDLACTALRGIAVQGRVGLGRALALAIGKALGYEVG